VSEANASRPASTPASTAVPLPASVALDVLSTIGCVFLALLTAGFAAFRMLKTLPPGASANVDVSFFTAINALTLTGFSHNNAAVPDYPMSGKLVLVVLAVGGALLSLVGGGYFLSRATGVRLSHRSLWLAASAIIFGPMVLSAWVGATDLVFASTSFGQIASPSISMAGRVVLEAVAVPGLVGVVALLCVFSKRAVAGAAVGRRRDLANSVLAMCVLYLCGTVMLRWAGETGWLGASMLSLDMRGLGLAGERVDATPATLWLSIALMSLGAGPASTAGGLGVLPLVIVGRCAWDALRGREVDGALGVAVAWISAYVLTIAGVVLGLTVFEPAVTGERLLLLAVGSVSNVGRSIDPLATTGGGLFVLSGGMVVGRLLPLAMLGWLAVVVAPLPDRGRSVNA
jgi:hypothetical protein